MEKVFAILLLLLFGHSAKTQNYPIEWSRYANTNYFYDIESGSNDKQIDETKFRNNLLDLARANLSKQIQVKVEEVSQLDKTANKGNTDIHYFSLRRFTTDLDLKFAKTESHTNYVSGQVFAIAYINKREACQYYENEFQILLSKVDNAFQIAEKYVQQGFKPKAKNELQQALAELDSSDELFFWFNVFGMSELQLQQYIGQVHQAEQNLKTNIADLEYGTTCCIVCKANNFGKPYPILEKEVKGQLSQMGCNFVDTHDSADYVVRIEASSREYNKMNTIGNLVYFIYVDVSIVIDKNATGQRIFENEISVKGSHTISYEEAAREGYKKVGMEIGNLLKENIMDITRVE